MFSAKLLAITASLCLLLVAPAGAANQPNALFDQVASGIAGHPVDVWCENDQADWHTLAEGWTLPPEQTHTIYISPYNCKNLWTLLQPSGHKFWPNGPLTLDEAALAIHTLVHESVHQIGGEFADCTDTDETCEARTDCKALTLDAGVAANSFGFGPVHKTFYRTVTRSGWTGRTVESKTVPNKNLGLLKRAWQNLHGSLPAMYQGVC